MLSAGVGISLPRPFTLVISPKSFSFLALVFRSTIFVRRQCRQTLPSLVFAPGTSKTYPNHRQKVHPLTFRAFYSISLCLCMLSSQVVSSESSQSSRVLKSSVFPHVDQSSRQDRVVAVESSSHRRHYWNCLYFCMLISRVVKIESSQSSRRVAAVTIGIVYISA